MPTTTTAIVFSRAGEVSLLDFPMPDPRPGEVQVRTRYSGVSAGTEGWCLAGRFTWAPTPFPCVPGYQRVGTITALGPGVTGLSIGQTVAATFGSWTSDIRPFWGAHIGLANTTADEIYPLSEGTDPVDAANCIVAQVGFNAASRISLTPGDWVAVYGDGLIGQMASQAARARGARTILIGHRAARLALATAHSADATLDNRHADLAPRVREICGDRPLSAVIDTVQTLESEREYVPLLQRGQGQVVYSGFTPGNCWSDMGLVQRAELTCHHVSGWTRARLESTLDLIAQRRLRVRPLTTHLVPARDAPEIWRMITGKSADFTGITFDWQL